MIFKKSESFFEEAKKIIPGGVNSPVRAFRSVGGTPVFMKSGKGSRMTDVDGNNYIDFIGSWGPHLFGHNPPFIRKALKEAMKYGTSFGTPTELEIKTAKLITELVPSVEMVRMVNSGTEATMSAVRAARAYTRRDKFIKFEGCYHGHADHFLIKAGSGALTFGVPTSPGVTAANAADTLIASYNNIDSVKDVVQAFKNQIAAIILEPVVGNMGVVIPKKEFLTGLRQICSEENIVLIFDEVMTGFRVAQGGAQELYNIRPDLSTFGKIIGGGLPVGAFGGRSNIMEMIAPSGPVYQAGTLSGNPLAMAAGYASLKYIKDHPGIYKDIENKSARLEKGIRKNLKKLNKKFIINRVGSMMSLFFTEEEVVDYESALRSDTSMYGKYFHAMLRRGIYLPPAQFEAFFVSSVHSKKDIDTAVAANLESLKEILEGQ
jgi:glutamate-1-semialdehyde 2,1-aminomutase